MYPCKQTNYQHRTDLPQIDGPLASPPTWSYAQPDKTWAECVTWLSFIPLWLVAYYIFHRTFHFSLSSSSPFPQQQVMAPQRPQPGVIESKSSRKMGASSNGPLAETQQQRRHQLVHCNTAIAATENMAHDAHLTIVCKARRSNIGKQHAIGCEYLHIDVEGGQLTIQCTAGVRRELCDQFIMASNGKPSLSTNAFVRTVREIEHQYVIRSEIFAHEYHDNGPREWAKQVSMSLE